MAFLQSPILARRRVGVYSPETARKFRKDLQTQTNVCDFQVVQRELNKCTSFALLESNASVVAQRKGKEKAKQTMEQLVTIKDGLDRVKTVEKCGIEYGEDVVERVETALIKEQLALVKGVVDKVRERIKTKEVDEFNIIITDDDIKFKYVSNTCKASNDDTTEDVENTREDIGDISEKVDVTDEEGYASNYLGDDDDCSLGFDIIEQPPCDTVTSTKSLILSSEVNADNTHDEFTAISPVVAKPSTLTKEQEESFPRIHRNKVQKAEATEPINTLTHIVNDAPVYSALPQQPQTPENTFYVNINNNRSRPNFDRKIEIVYDPVPPPPTRPWSSASTAGPIYCYLADPIPEDGEDKRGQRSSVVTTDSGNISDFDYSEVSSLGDPVSPCSPTPSNVSGASIETQSDITLDFDLCKDLVCPEIPHYKPPIPSRPRSINRRVKQLATRATGLLHSASADLSKFKKNMSARPKPMGFYHRNLQLKPDFDLRSQLNESESLNKDATLDLDTRLRLGKDVDLPELDPLPRWDIIPGYADTTVGHKAWWMRKQAAADKERKESLINDMTELVSDKVDVLVRAIVSRCTCKVPFQLDRVGDGKYKLPQTSQLFFVRILRNHVMVRVGGGWDTLDHFIAKHDPCRMKFKQITGTPNYKDTQSKINTGLSTQRNRSASCINSPNIDNAELSDDVQSWISEDYVPAAKVPRSQLQRSNSARYARKLNYSSESEDGLKHVGSEAEFSSPLVSLRRNIEDINSQMDDGAPLTTFNQSPRKTPARSRTNSNMSDDLLFSTRKDTRSRSNSQMSGDMPLTSFNQTPKKERSRTNTTSRSMIPVSNVTRSKSCERYKANHVSNQCNINRSKSGDRMNNMAKVKIPPSTPTATPTATPSAIVTPRKYSTTTPLKYSKSGTAVSDIIDQGKTELEANFTKTPRSLLANPTSATAKKVLRSKSSDSMMKNIVSLQSDQLQTPVSRTRAKSTDTHSANKIFKSRPKHILSKSMSTDRVRNNMINSEYGTQNIIMKPDLAVLNGSTPKTKDRSFRDWLKRRKNEK